MAGPGGDWPRTWRAMPWAIAAFLAMVFLLPVDSIAAPIELPFDSKLDRVLLGGVLVLWLFAAVGGGRFGPRPRHSAIDAAVALLLLAAFASVVANVETLARLGELELSLKKLGLLLAFAAFFLVAVTTIRPAEGPAFCKLIVGLACLTAAGTILEYRTGTNVFFDLAQALLPAGFGVSPPPADSEFGRAAVTGPTLHGLEVATLLALALSVAAVRALQAGDRAGRIAWAAASALILAGAVSTDRKAAAIVPLAVLVVLVVYRPRPTLRLAPLGLAMLLLVPLVAPGALGSIRGQLQPDRLASSGSTTGRTGDYRAVLPDLRTRPALGRGYGSYDPHRYRILDNQYLGLAVESGVIGLAAFVLLLVATVAVAHRAIRSHDPVRGPPALAAAAATGAVAVAAALFDLLAFPQVPYVFFFLVALAVVSARGVRGPTPSPPLGGSADVRPGR